MNSILRYTNVRTKPPVAVVILDSLRADMIDQGDLIAQLPTMRRLFRESYVFTHAYAPAHWTVPSHASLFTGLRPSEHMAHPPYLRLREDVLTAAEVFRKGGYFTACITCNPFLSDRFGLTRGFEVVWMPPSHTDLIAFGLQLAIQFISTRIRQDDGLLSIARDWLNLMADLVMASPRRDNRAHSVPGHLRRLLQENGRPSFFLVNLMEAHHPYYARGAYSGLRNRFRYREIFRHWIELGRAIMGGRVPLTDTMQEAIVAIYWENVRYLDSQLDLLVQNLQNGFLDGGFLFVLSDHGHLLGEKGCIDHVGGLSEKLIRVPLLIRPPGGTPGQRIDHPTDIRWLFSLFRAIALSEQGALDSWLSWIKQQGIIVSEAHGDYVPYVDRLKGRNPLYRKDLLDFKARHDHPAIACIAGRWKLICHLGRREDELYDLMKDMHEDVNLAEERREVLEDLHEKLKESFFGGTRGPPRQVRKDGLPMDAKKVIAEVVIAEALKIDRNTVLVWTGGKDSTLVLFLALHVARRENLEVPPLLSVDHGQHFPETLSFMKDIARRERLEVIVARNENLLATVGNNAETVPLDTLD
ncbi:MAG: sulfatase-like hydrolase/transferase, partial [bacterium]